MARRRPAVSRPTVVDRRRDWDGPYLALLGPNCRTEPATTPCLRLVCRLHYGGPRFGVPRLGRRPWVGDFYAAEPQIAFEQLAQRFAGGAVTKIEVLEIQDLRSAEA